MDQGQPVEIGYQTITSGLELSPNILRICTTIRNSSASSGSCIRSHSRICLVRKRMAMIMMNMMIMMIIYARCLVWFEDWCKVEGCSEEEMNG